MTTLERALKILLLSLALCAQAHGQDWIQATTAPTGVWLSMAGSQHGSNLVAAAYSDELFTVPGQIYASTNGGQTWSPTSAPSNFWFSVAASADGQRLVAGAYIDPTYAPGQIFISTNGSLTWTACSNAPARNWQAVGSSADGRILVGATYNDYIFVSTNSGADWFQTATNNNWQALAVSTNGLRMYATTPSGIYITTNSGSTWYFSTSSPTFSYSVVCSADGSKVFTGLEGGSYSDSSTLGIYASTNGGATWNQTSAPIDDVQNYQCLSLSTHGNLLLAGAISSENHGLVYLSADGGSTWIPQAAPANSWGCVFCSADGALLTAGEFGGSIYSAIYVPPPYLTIAAVLNQVVVSWPVSATGFQLQTSTNLNSSGSWTNISSGIVVTGTNYFLTNNILSPQSFFRLKKP
jgi:photosystem II stability/assembly factor-like uncharacterized protein